MLWYIKILQFLALGKLNFLEKKNSWFYISEQLKSVWKISHNTFLETVYMLLLICHDETNLHCGYMGLARFIFLCLTSGESMKYDHNLNTQKNNNNSYICFLTCSRPTFKKPVYFLYRSIFNSGFVFDDISKVLL